MRHTPCGCRSAHLVEVQPNFRLPPVSTMRRAQQCRYFARSLPPSKRHSRLTIVRRGCWMCRNVGIHGEAMYTAPDYPQGVCHIRKAAELPTAVQSAGCAALRATNCQCKISLGGFKGGYSLLKESIPLYPCSAKRCSPRGTSAAASFALVRKREKRKQKAPAGRGEGFLLCCVCIFRREKITSGGVPLCKY